MSVSAYAMVTTLLTLMGLAGLLSLRVVGLYSHQALAVVLLLGCGWAIASRVWLAWKGRLHPGLLRGFRGLDIGLGSSRRWGARASGRRPRPRAWRCFPGRRKRRP